MDKTPPAFKKYIFVCENEREIGACCNPLGAKLRERLKEMVKQSGFSKTIRVSRTGCLDSCAEGPNVLLMPDNIWFKRVNENDLEEIIRVAQGR